MQEYLGEQRLAIKKHIAEYGVSQDFKENVSSAVRTVSVEMMDKPGKQLNVYIEALTDRKRLEDKIVQGYAWLSGLPYLNHKPYTDSLESVNALARMLLKNNEINLILPGHGGQIRAISSALVSISQSLTVAFDFDETMSAKDTVLAWAEMIQREKGYGIDDYLRGKSAYAESKTKENLANEFSFFEGRPRSDLIKLAQEIELNPKFLDAVKLIKDIFKVNSLPRNIVSAGIKNIIEAFLNRGEIERILRKEGITIGTIKANQLVVKDEKFTNEFKGGIITGPEKADFIAPGTLYVGDDSDEKNLSGKIEFLVNIYWPRQKIESAVRDYKEKISKAVRWADNDGRPEKIKERGPSSPLLPGEFLVKF
ncbi:MAG: HAD family hydrolase, partial [Candidatus Omnitrophota bacterium]